MNVLEPNADRNAMIKPITYAALGIALFVGAAIVLSTVQHDAVAANSPSTPAAPAAGIAGNHRVAPGETLFSIARMYYGDAAKWPAIANANGIGSPKALQAGQLIVIPTHGTPSAAELPQPQSPSEVVRQFVLHSPFDRQERFAAIVANDQTTSVKLFARSPSGTAQLSCSEFPAATESLSQAWVSDTDGDGCDELYTVWTRGKSDAITRLFAQTASGLVIASESTHCPVAPALDWPIDSAAK